MSEYPKPPARATPRAARPRAAPPRDRIRVTRDGPRQEWTFDGWPARLVGLAMSIAALAAAYGWAR